MSSITFDNLSDIIDNSQNVVLENINSPDDINDALNVFVIAIGAELTRLAEQQDTRDHRVAATAIQALWGELYQPTEDSETVKNFCELLKAFKKESENAWVNLTWQLAICKYIFEFAVHTASLAAEKGNTNALEALKNHKANLQSFTDIIDLVY